MRSTFITQYLHRAGLYLVLMAAAWIGLYGLTLPADVPQDVPVTSAVQVYPDATPGRDIFNPAAELDTSQIDVAPVWQCPAEEELVLWPEGAVHETTPMIPVPGTCYVVPEESPDGGHILPYSRWVDDSPVYDDGWVLLVNDLRGSVSWRAPIGDCSAVDWTAQDADGRAFAPFDANNDQRIDCGSDIELGA